MRIAMNRAFQDFLDALAVSPDRVGLYAAMKDMAGAFDLTAFAYIFAPSEHAAEVRLISNYPTSWTSHYLAKRYDTCDPVIALAKTSADPFDWGVGAQITVSEKAHDGFMQEAAAFGICCGFTFPIRDAASHYAALSFASDQWSPGFRSCFERQQQVLHLLAILFHKKARIALSPSASVAGVRLSAREAECLKWATQGKSAWEIGRILNISRRTAAFHLDNAKLKLGVRTIQQAVALFAASHTP